MATDIETVFNLHLMIMIMTCYIKRLSQHSLSGIYAGPCHAYCGCLWIYILLAYTVTLQIINYPQSTQQHFSCKKGPTCLFDPPEASRSRIFSRPGGLYIVSKTRNHCLIVVFSGMKFDKEGKLTLFWRFFSPLVHNVSVHPPHLHLSVPPAPYLFGQCGGGF